MNSEDISDKKEHSNFTVSRPLKMSVIINEMLRDISTLSVLGEHYQKLFALIFS